MVLNAIWFTLGAGGRRLRPARSRARRALDRLPGANVMSVTKTQVLDQLRRVKGPDLEGNIVDLGLISEILIKDSRVYFSITVPPERATELEPLRMAAEKVAGDIPGVTGVTAVLTAERAQGEGPGAPRTASRRAVEHPRVQQARAQGVTGDGASGRAQAAAG